LLFAPLRLALICKVHPLYVLQRPVKFIKKPIVLRPNLAQSRRSVAPNNPDKNGFFESLKPGEYIGGCLTKAMNVYNVLSERGLPGVENCSNSNRI
jgi:hypothetical protein